MAARGGECGRVVSGDADCRTVLLTPRALPWILSALLRILQSNGPVEAINGRLEHLHGSALGFRNFSPYALRCLPSAPRNLWVAQNIQHVTVRTPREEAPDTPRLVGKGMHDLRTHLLCQGIDRLHVVDLYRNIRHHRRGLVVGGHTQLPRWILRVSQRDDPPVIHHLLQTEKVRIEIC